MQEITIGEVIKYLRMDKGYSKSLLCHGICSITALTRYEEGVRIPDVFLLECLLQRLGMDMCQFEIIINKNDYQLIKQRKIIDELLDSLSIVAAREALEKYQKLVRQSKNIHNQYIFYVLGRIEYVLKNYQVSHELFSKALSFSKCDYINNKDIRVLSTLELKILSFIAKICVESQRLSEAFFLYSRIISDLQSKTYVDSSSKLLYYECLFNVAKIDFQNKNWGLVQERLDELIKGYAENFFLYDYKGVFELKLELEERMKCISSSQKCDYERKIFALSLLEKKSFEEIDTLLENSVCRDMINHL